MTSHDILITFVSASVLGVILMLIAKRLKISAIVALLIGGILAGPEFMGIVRPADLGDGLNTIISLAVGLILFEGGLTLDIKGYTQVSSEIWGVLTRGVIVTWGLSTISIKLIFGFDWSLCLLAGSLIIVTGPTVIGPMLQRIRVKKRLHDILYWEAVLIDPIGVFLALLCYEWIISSGTQEVYINFFSRFLVGAIVGMVFGVLIYQFIKRNFIPEEKLNIFVLATAMLNYAMADSIISESGLLSVTITGFWLGYKKTPLLDKIIAYKVELKDFLTGLLFVLLAANLVLSKFLNYGIAVIGVLAIVMLVIRPVNIFVSTLKSSISFKEKLFLSWIAPRGIVAASMASLFSFHLAAGGYENADFLETFTYGVIAGTVILQGFSAKWVGKMLGVLEPKPNAWLIVGAHKLARAVAKFIQDRGRQVVLVDLNPREIKLSRKDGFTAICENAMSIDPAKQFELYGTGNILVITENNDLNQLICQRWQKLFSEARIMYWDSDSTESEDKQTLKITGEAVWTRLNIRTILAQNIQHDELITCVDKAPLNVFFKPDETLMCEYNGDFYPDPPYEKKGEATFLTLRPISSGLEKYTKKEWISLSEDKTLDVLYADMLELLKPDFPRLDIKSLQEDLIRREKEYTSLIGHGISLPHTYTSAIYRSVLLVAKLNKPIVFQYNNKNNAGFSIVFMVLSPEDGPEAHLGLISKIAKLAMKETTRRALDEATTIDEIYDIIEKG